MSDPGINQGRNEYHNPWLDKQAVLAIFKVIWYFVALAAICGMTLIAVADPHYFR